MATDPTSSTAPVTVGRWSADAPQPEVQDLVTREEPLEIRVRGQGIAITMRTPGHDDELAAGFLWSEGLLKSGRDVTGIGYCTSGEAARHQNILNVYLASDVEVDLQKLSRHVFASSSCGLCGKASIEAVHQHFAPVLSNCTISSSALLELPEKLRARQSAFHQTGGLHAAGLFSTDGELLLLREDVGRHNAVDKVIGHGLLNGTLPYEDRVLLVSGRASFEIIQKALSARIPVIAAVSAPSSLAVELAQESGQTLIGFLRQKTFNVYTHTSRVGLGSSEKGRSA